MLVDWTAEFDTWLTWIEEQGGVADELVQALLEVLEDLPGPPTEETATLKQVKQARRHKLWRLAHTFIDGVAIRLIVWFPGPDQAVIALVGFNKAQHGDVWYSSAAIRGEAMVDQWLRQGRGQ